jgi:uncharacterized protein
VSKALHSKWDALVDLLQHQQRVLVAFSGGCDSTFLLAVARKTLGKENVLAVTAVSASLPARERQATERLAASLDTSYQPLSTDELQNPAYAANPSNRCFFCKDELYSRLAPLAQAHRMILADGFNVSDRSDVRPGLQAAKNWNVSHPLDQADLEKQDIRVLSRWLRLPTWNKPASPCLSSRIPYGTPVTVNVLSQIEQAEKVLHAEGFAIVRVRHLGELARIEVPLNKIERLKESIRWERITAQLHALGYRDIEIDARGFKSGRLNEEIPSPAR